MNNCWLIHPNLVFKRTNRRSPEASLKELKSLAKAINFNLLFAEIVRVSSIKAGTYFGKGKIDDIKLKIENTNNQGCILIINTTLTPIQQRNLERSWNTKVLDRTALILEIFGARAATKEGSLQVELAHISWQKTRLVRSWTHLERQRGGKGFLGGPGELQIELDRRYISRRIKKIKLDLNKIRNARKLQRNKRQNLFPLVSLIGYTNSGKSTLFNKITGSKEFAKDMLFATLDPKHRRVNISQKNDFILSDTVGFLSNLPTELIESFKATLDEIIYADLILHVRDISHKDYNSQNIDVLEIVSGLFGYDNKQIPDNFIEVINKIDNINFNGSNYKNTKNKVYISAKTGKGIKTLINLIISSINNKFTNNKKYY